MTATIREILLGKRNEVLDRIKRNEQCRQLALEDLATVDKHLIQNHAALADIEEALAEKEQ